MPKVDDSPRFTNIAQIKAANKAKGYFWFSPSTVRMFKSRVESRIYENNSTRFWVESIRTYDDDGSRAIKIACFDIHTHDISWASVAYRTLYFPTVKKAEAFITEHLI